MVTEDENIDCSLLTNQVEHCDLPGRTLRSEVHPRHEQQGVTAVKLRVLGVLPRELSHVSVVLQRHRMAGVPHLQYTSDISRINIHKKAHISHINSQTFGQLRNESPPILPSSVLRLTFHPCLTTFGVSPFKI